VLAWEKPQLGPEPRCADAFGRGDAAEGSMTMATGSLVAWSDAL